MTKRLQVILQDGEYREIKRLAGSRHLSIAAWVRQALTTARQQEPVGDASRKLDRIRAAALLDYPTADMDQLLEQIERGYRATDAP